MNTGVWRDGQSVVQYSQPAGQGINFMPPGKSKKWRHAGLLINILASVLSGLSPGQGHCVVFLGKTLLSQYLPLPMWINGMGRF